MCPMVPCTGPGPSACAFYDGDLAMRRCREKFLPNRDAGPAIITAAQVLRVWDSNAVLDGIPRSRLTLVHAMAVVREV